MQHLSEQNIFIFLVQIFLLLGCARAFGELFRKWKQPPLTAEIIAGIILGPTVFGRFFPVLHQTIFPADIIQQNMLETLAWLGVFFLLLETGLEVDFSSAWRQRGDALKIAVVGVIVPMVIAFIPCLYLSERYLANPDQRIAFAFFMATAMSITAMPIVARALHDLNLSKTDLSFLIMSAHSVNDIIGWLVFTIVLSLFVPASLGIAKITTVLLATIGFVILCLTMGRTMADFAIAKIKARHIPEPGGSLTFISLLGFLCGAITQKIGIQALFGFFIAGIIVGQARALSEKTRHVISQMVYAVFVPLFFASIGLRIDFFKNFDIFIVLLVSIIGIGGKFLGGWLGAYLSKTPKSNYLPIAVSHIPGGTMEIIIGVLALQYRLITEPVFVAIVFGAVISAIILGPWLNYSVKQRKEIGILEFLSRRRVIAQLGFRRKEKAIQELCDVAVDAESILQKEDICRAVLQREQVLGTAIEEGIALPHARFLTLKQPIIAFGRSLSGIEWDSPDGKPAQFIFLILTPQDDEEIQVQILSLIARAMIKVQTREIILQARDTEDLWPILQDIFNAQHVVRK